VYMAIQSVIEGAFKGGLREFGLAEDGVGYAVDEYNEALITDDVRAKVEEAKAAIIAGRIVVPKS